MAILPGIEARDVPIYETFVVPRYLTTFGSLLLEQLLPCERARVVYIGCRTGYPDQQLAKLLPGSKIVGFDPSPASIELARTKSSVIKDATFEYEVSDLPLPVSEPAFSHAIALHPFADPSGHDALIREMHRVLMTGGQALIATPMRGSFQEIADLLREYALKHEAGELTNALESNITRRPTLEMLAEALEQVGLDEVDVDVRTMKLLFRSGRDFFEDPISRLMIVPDVESSIGIGGLAGPLKYVREAIDLYWSEGEFELSVNVGCASGRRL